MNFSTTQARESETHAVLDFSVGKNVGIGLFTPNEVSSVDFGVRIAQFVTRATSSIHARPDWQKYIYETSFSKYLFPHTPLKAYKQHWHTFAGEASSERSLNVIGPRISWKDSVPIVGDSDSGILTFDWGAGGALLFGRRKAFGQHQESGHFKHYGGKSQYYTNNAKFARSATVVVPDVGGFVGISMNYRNAKVSMGYRGDVFIGGVDTGWDRSHLSSIGLFGPYAKLSIGLGG